MNGFAPTSFLFHGPGAKVAAVGKVPELGKLQASYGDTASQKWLDANPSHKADKYNGLYIIESREIVQEVMVVPATYTPVYLIGPLCSTGSADAADVLLKTLEDTPPHVRIVLWAWDIGGVRPPIVSRSRPVWAPGNHAHTQAVLNMMPHADAAVGAWLAKDIAAACLITKEHAKDDLDAWVQGVAACLPKHGKAGMALWPSLRKLTCLPAPQMAEVMGVWLHVKPRN